MTTLSDVVFWAAVAGSPVVFGVTLSGAALRWRHRCYECRHPMLGDEVRQARHRAALVEPGSIEHAQPNYFAGGWR